MEIVNVRLSRAAVVALAVAALAPLAGCGSGGGSSPVSTVLPIATPSPSVLSSTIPSTSDTGVTTRADYTNPNLPYIAVSFPAPAPAGFGTVAKYHIYRNDTIIAELDVQSSDAVFVSGNEPKPTNLGIVDQGFAVPFDYITLGTLPAGLFPTQAVLARSPGAKAFSADTPIVYRITLLYGTLDRLGQTTYTETEIGRSNQITPFR